MAPLRLQNLLALPPSLRSAAVSRIFRPAVAAIPPPPSQPSERRHQSNTAHPPPNSSVNESEISHFTQLASSWWDPHGSSRLLHLMNPLRHDFIQRCLSQSHCAPEDADAEAKKQRSKLHYLDIGCGGGIFAESAARRARTASVTAIDPTPDVIAVARKHQRRDPLLLEPGRLQYKNMPIEDLPQSGAGYDVITLFEVLEHITHPAPFLSTCLSHLRPGGWLVGSTIARSGTSWFTTKFMAEEVLRLVPRGTHEWGQYIQPEELREWARKQEGLEFGSGGKGGWEVMGVVYAPGLGWKEVRGSEGWGNYFFGMRKRGNA